MTEMRANTRWAAKGLLLSFFFSVSSVRMTDGEVAVRSFCQIQRGWAVLLIGVCTAVLSFVGELLGRRVGRRFGGPAEIAGGVILILIGTRVLLQHTGIL